MFKSCSLENSEVDLVRSRTCFLTWFSENIGTSNHVVHVRRLFRNSFSSNFLRSLPTFAHKNKVLSAPYVEKTCLFPFLLKKKITALQGDCFRVSQPWARCSVRSLSFQRKTSKHPVVAHWSAITRYSLVVLQLKTSKKK